MSTKLRLIVPGSQDTFLNKFYVCHNVQKKERIKEDQSALALLVVDAAHNLQKTQFGLVMHRL